MSTVTVHNCTYEILEESTPYFLGRWFEKGHIYPSDGIFFVLG